MINYDKVADILSKGGHLVMHKNDIERLKQARIAGNQPPICDNIKIVADKTGMLLEGDVIATRLIGLDDGEHHRFDFHAI